MTRALALAVLVQCLAQCLVQCLTTVPFARASEPVVVTAKDFTEQAIVAELTKQLLDARGFTVDKALGLTTSQMHGRMDRGLGDIYWEYTSTRLILSYGEARRLDAASSFSKVKELDRQKGLLWLGPTGINNTYALAMRAPMAEQSNIATISDLVAKMRAGGHLIWGINQEFAERPDGFVPMERAYAVAIPRDKIRMIDTEHIYQALKITWIDVGLVFSTDGRIQGYGFKLLEDDRDYFYNYILAPVIKKETADAHPQLVGILEQLASKLDNRTISRLNAQADIDRRLIRTIAQQFLRESGLLEP